jgi:hypothetical protein
MVCPRGKNKPQDCPRCEHVIKKSKMHEFLKMEIYWICNYPYLGDSNVSILELKNKIGDNNAKT